LNTTNNNDGFVYLFNVQNLDEDGWLYLANYNCGKGSTNRYVRFEWCMLWLAMSEYTISGR